MGARAPCYRPPWRLRVSDRPLPAAECDSTGTGHVRARGPPQPAAPPDRVLSSNRKRGRAVQPDGGGRRHRAAGCQPRRPRRGRPPATTRPSAPAARRGRRCPAVVPAPGLGQRAGMQAFAYQGSWSGRGSISSTMKPAISEQTDSRVHRLEETGSLGRYQRRRPGGRGGVLQSAPQFEPSTVRPIRARPGLVGWGQNMDRPGVWRPPLSPRSRPTEQSSYAWGRSRLTNSRRDAPDQSARTWTDRPSFRNSTLPKRSSTGVT